MLTDQAIRAMTPPEKGYRILWDGKLKGFGCRITARGTRAFVVLVQSGRPLTIGRWPETTLAEARRSARLRIAEKTLGKIHPARTAFEEAVQSYLDDRAPRLRPRSLMAYTRLLKHFDYGRTAIADVTPRDILAALRPLPPIEKHQSFATARAFFRWCVRQHLIDRSPCENLEAPLIASIPRIQGSPYLFPAARQVSDNTTCFNGWSQAKAALDKQLYDNHQNGLCKPFEPWTLHDLRRSVASYHAQLGTSQIVVEKLLNHTSGGTQSPIAQVYNR